MNNWIVITGASTGIGRAAAEDLAKSGYHVFAGVRKAEDAPKADRIEPLIIDIAKSDSIAAAKDQVTARVGTSGLKALVNNAGIGVAGPTEFVTLDEWRKQFDVNFFGHIAVTQAMLPLIRQHVAATEKGAGRILFTSSIGGIIGTPCVGPYCATKFAVEALCDSLRLELYDLGIHVTSIEPGVISTPIWGKAETDLSRFGPDHPARKLYGELMQTVENVTKKANDRGISPEVVGRAITKCIKAKTPPAQKLVGYDAKMAATAHNLLPTRIFDKLIRLSMKR